MSKRPSNSESNIISKKTKHWSLGLLESMKDPKCIVKRTEIAVVIRDRYPKAKIHYLVLPLDDINSIYKLNRSHITLLEHFGKLFEQISNEETRELKAGFHAIPSMQRLHMHIISKDMISPCLKTKVHWNSFTTNFFIPYEDILKELKGTGVIQKISGEIHKKLMNTPLTCNQCNFQPKNMPQLKEHIQIHDK